MKNKMNEILDSVKENKRLELREVVKLIQGGISVEDFNNFITELSKINERAAQEVCMFISKHLNSIKEGVGLDELIKKDNEDFYIARDAELAEKLKMGGDNIDIYCGEDDMKISKEIEEKITKIKEDIENGKVGEVLNSEFGKSLAASLVNDLEQTKAMMRQNGCNCCCDLHDADVYDDEEDIEEQHGSIDLGNGYRIEKIRKDNIEDELANLPYGFEESSKEEIDNTEMSSLDSLDCNFYKYEFDPKTTIVGDEQLDMKLPEIMATERYSSEGEIEEQVNDICEKIKCDDDRTKIACIVSDVINWDYLIDGINCNIIPIGVLNVALIINVGLDVKDIKIDKSMNDINEIMVVYEDDHFIGTNEVPLYKLIGAGLAIVIPIEEMCKTLEFSPVEFRGITKLVEYSEMSKLLN